MSDMACTDSFFMMLATEEEEGDEEAGGGAVDLILGCCKGCDSGVVGGFVIQGMHGQIRGCPILQEPKKGRAGKSLKGSGLIIRWERFTNLYLSCYLFISMFIFLFFIVLCYKLRFF